MRVCMLSDRDISNLERGEGDVLVGVPVHVMSVRVCVNVYPWIFVFVNLRRV